MRSTALRLVDSRGSIVSGTEAAVEVIAIVSGGRWPASLARRWPILYLLLDRSYARLAANRQRLSQLVPDMAPTVRP